jgi:hypothetical protein
MSARKAAAPEPEQDFYRFRSFAEVAEMFGLSPKAMTVLAEETDFPVFSRKVSPALMAAWLRRNSRRLRLIKVHGE